MVLTNSDGTVVRDTRRERMAGLLQFADVSSANATLRRLVDYLLEYHGDPEKKLAPLYDIIELTEEIFGGKDKAAVSLGISVKQMKAAGPSSMTSKSAAVVIADKKLAFCVSQPEQNCSCAKPLLKRL